jgi:hypothetical protein
MRLRHAGVVVLTLALLPATGARATPPTIDSVDINPPRHLAATWTLAPTMRSYLVEVATSPETYSDGFSRGEFLAENRVQQQLLLTVQSTSWTSRQLPGGTLWVHVAAFDLAVCPNGLAIGCDKEFSEAVPITVGKGTAVLDSVGQIGRRLTAAWRVNWFMTTTFLEVAMSPAVYTAGPSTGQFLDEHTVIFDQPSSGVPYQSTQKLPGGTYYVHVGARDMAGCPGTQAMTCDEISATMKFELLPNPPKLGFVGYSKGQLSASWTLPSDMFNDFIEVATSPATYPDGSFLEENTVLFDDALDLRDSAYEASVDLPPGTYYVHVGGFVPSFCPTIDALTCRDEFSPLMKLVVPGGDAPAGPAAASASADTRTAFAALSVGRRSVRSLSVRAAMDEAGTIIANGTVSVPGSARVYKFRTTSARATPGKAVRLRLRLSKRAVRAVKKSLRRHRRVLARLTITARDNAGNTKIEKRTVRLKR